MNISIGIAYAIIAMVSFGLSEIFAKLATDKIGGKKAMLFSQLFGILLIAGYIALFIEIPEFTFQTLGITVLCSIFAGIGLITFFKAMEIGNVSIASPIAANWVIVTVIMSLIFLKESLTFLQSISLIILMLGIFLLSIVWKDFKKAIKSGISVGVKESLITMFCWGIGFFLLKFVVDAWGTIFPIIFFRGIGFIMAYTIIAKNKLNINITPKIVILFLTLAALFDIVGLITYSTGIQTEYVSIVSPIAAAAPLITIILAYIFIKERMILNQKIGALLILTGLILISIV